MVCGSFQLMAQAARRLIIALHESCLESVKIAAAVL